MDHYIDDYDDYVDVIYNRLHRKVQNKKVNTRKTRIITQDVSSTYKTRKEDDSKKSKKKQIKHLEEIAKDLLSQEQKRNMIVIKRLKREAKTQHELHEEYNTIIKEYSNTIYSYKKSMNWQLLLDDKIINGRFYHYFQLYNKKFPMI
jgi:hypothetical protein